MSGFPPGLNPPSWMGDFVQKKLDPERAKSILVTEIIYPGSHDCATYGEGLEDFSYQCQDKTLYEQMMVGHRFFDLRLGVEDKKFIPVHGIAKHTANDFGSSPREAKEKDLASQIMRFAKEHPSEIIIVKVTLTLEGNEQKELWGETAMNLLGERLQPPPTNGSLTYHEVVESNRNIILVFAPMNLKGGKENTQPIANHYWNVGNPSPHWMGNNDEQLWNEPIWQSGDLKKALHSTEEWMEKNKEKIQQRDRFWVAQMQLTPALGQGITTFFKDGASIRPKDLAMGGGLSLPGSNSEGSNKELLQSGVLKKAFWRQHCSILQYDFANTQNAGAIVAMNLGGGAGGDDGEEEHGEEDHGHEGGAGGRGRGRGGRGGRGGGRGGGGEHGEEPHEREEHAGHGRGRGRGGRGGHQDD